MYKFLILPSWVLAEIIFYILVNSDMNNQLAKMALVKQVLDPRLCILLANFQLELRAVFGVKWEFMCLRAHS